MPTVSKRFSFKSLKRRFTSDSSNASERSDKTPSPSRLGRSETLPSDLEKGYTTAGGAKQLTAEPSNGSSSTEEYPYISNGTGSRSLTIQKELVPPLPTPPATIGMPSPQLYASPEASPTPFDPVVNLAVGGVMEKIYEGPKSSKAEKLLNKVDDLATATQDPNGLVVAVIQPVKSLLESSGAMKAIEEGINTFMEDIPWLMKGLDEIARIHPVVTVAVLAFKTVYKMEMTRRENDRRIQALYVEMKDMMAVLIQLRDVHDRNDVGPDGRTIEARLQSLVGKTATDIKECANACDTYSKKRLLVKILRGQTWETKLVGFAGVFTQRRVQFEQALTMHTARVVDAIHEDVHHMKQAMDAANAKLQMIFDTLIPQDLATLKQKVKAKGDINVLMSSSTALKELNEDENKLASHQGNERSTKRSEFTVEDLKVELRIDFDASLKGNFEAFEGKFNLYHRQLKDDLSRAIDEANNRVISAVREGPHDKIKNEELKTIWKEMGWRRNVKARLFVMTLRDHFREKVQEIKLDAAAGASKEQLRTDDWALDYISVTWLQPIMEAFDDDGSGYITIAELNQFTDSMPKDLGWSLQHWIAYWAVGWQYAVTQYIEKIKRIISMMNALRTRILPENRLRAEYYLDRVSSTLVNLSAGFVPSSLSENLQFKFQPFIEYEEARIRQNLQDIRYDFDAKDPVYIVAGPGRIEKYVLPLIYLLLERDLKIFRVAQYKYLDDDELWDSADTLLWVFDTITLRTNDLKDLYEQQKEDAEARFKVVACGLFKYMHDSNELWSSSNLLVDQVPEVITDTELEIDTLLSELEKDLNKPLRVDSPYKTLGYESPEMFAFVPGASGTGTLFGRWNGYIYIPTEYPERAMQSLNFQADPDNKQGIRGSGVDVDALPYTITGKYSVSESGTTEVQFTITYEGGDPTGYYTGHLDENGSLVGYQGYTEDVSEENNASLFILRNIPAEVMAHRPSPPKLAENKPRALWRFAIDVVLMQTRRKLFSWSFFKERRNQRRRYIELNIQCWYYGRPLTSEEWTEFLGLRRTLLPQDALYFLSLRKRLIEIIPGHFGYTCDACKQPIGGGRIICLDCRASTHWSTMDFCADSRCYSQPVTRLNLEKEHLPTHDLVKIRTNIQWHDLDNLKQSAMQVLRQWRLHPVPTSDVPQASDDVEKPSDSEAKVEELAPERAESPSEKPIHCFACQTVATEPFWYCTQCTDCVICDSCEIKSRIPCIICKQSFEQPTWFYGSQPKDQFMCNTCVAKGVEPPANLDKEVLHTYLHPLVRCKERVEDPAEPAQSTVEDRLTELECKVCSKQDSVEAKLVQIEQTLALLQQTMAALIDTKSNGHAL